MRCGMPALSAPAPPKHRKEHMPDVVSYLILDPHIVTYTLAGFLWGHVALHHDITKVSHLASSMAISLIPRLTVLVGAIFFIGLALIIIMVPITWDGVLDALIKK